MFNILNKLHQSAPGPVLAILLFVSGISQAETWAVTDRSVPVNAPTNTRMIFLDDQQRLEQLLSNELPTNPSQAAATIQSYLTSPAGRRLQRDLTQAQQGIAHAWSLGIEKIPAVVVDRQYIVYGETDVTKAVERINQARGSSQ